MNDVTKFGILFAILALSYFVMIKTKEGFEMIYSEFKPKEKKELVMDQRAKLEKEINDGFDNYNFGRKHFVY